MSEIIVANTWVDSSKTTGFVGGDASQTIKIRANSVDLLIANSTQLTVNNIVIPSNSFSVGTSLYSVSNGNIGIGNSSPAYKLHIEGVSFSSGLKVANAVASTTSDVSKQLDLYGGVCGLSVTSARLNYVVPALSSHYMCVGGTDIVLANSSGVHPGTSGVFDLGSTGSRWRNIYTSDLNLSNGIGNYTIVEGEDDLFLYNNKSGKVYKFALIEVDPSTATKKIGE